MIEDILPRQVASVEMYGDDPSANLLDGEAVQIDGAINSRVREFTTGRACGRQALRKLGLPSAPILRGSNRQPLWPSGVVGSITHCKGYRAAAVARQANMLTVAIDAEIHDELPPGVLKQVCRDEELEWLTDAPNEIHWDRIMFSAKESVYKAWFPLTGRWLGFEEALVNIDPALGEFHAHLLTNPPIVAGRELTDFAGRFLVRDGLVVTAIALSRNPEVL